MNRNPAAFTLIELLVVVAIIAVLIGIFFAVAPGVIKRGQATASLNNMRQIGNGFQMYAGDNDFYLPSRIESSDKWPRLIFDYLKDKKIYADPGDKNNFLRTHRDPLANNGNNTSYIMNGFNDVGAFQDEKIAIKVNTVDKPSQTILLGNQSNTRNYYMDTEEGNQNSGVLNKTSFGDGSNYLFADGSVRFIKKEDYRDELWLVHKPQTN